MEQRIAAWLKLPRTSLRGATARGINAALQISGRGSLPCRTYAERAARRICDALDRSPANQHELGRLMLQRNILQIRALISSPVRQK
jgi:hypothetical protein